jgi:hypothetical protein
MIMGLDWHRRVKLFGALIVSLLSLPVSPSAAEDSTGEKFSRDPADTKDCQANLNRIFGAIQQYRQQHQGKLPDRLSELMRKYISDPDTLVCPYVKRNGGLRQWRRENRELDFDPNTSYGYEFPKKEITDDLWRGVPKRTWREYKELQVAKLGELGLVVPVVRCHFHQPRLNLALGGRIYESGFYWEKNYEQLVPEEEMTPARLFSGPAGRKKLAAQDFLPRDSRAALRLIDLSEFYNGLLTDSWQGFPSNHLAQLSSGLHEFGGVPFDVRGVVQLCGEEHDFPFAFPEKLEGIRVNQKLDSIHFLHATAFTVRPATNIATYVIHYADSRVVEIPIVYGKQIADWWVDPKHPFEPAEAKVAWTGLNEAAKAYGKALRLYRFTWDNPLKDVEVASISLFSHATLAAPFLIAITIEP